MRCQIIILTDNMDTDNDQFFTKLYAIRPFKETESQTSSASKGQPPQELTNDPFLPTALSFPQPESFLNSTTPLRKINSEQPQPSELQIGESNRKTMTSISSTIDILFSKIQKIKEEFSFALNKPQSEPQGVSEWTPEMTSFNSQGDPPSIIDKENANPCDEKLSKIESKIEAVMQKLGKCRPLEPRVDNRLQAYAPQQPRQKKSQSYRDIFQPWAEERKVEGLNIRDFALGKCLGSGKFGDVYMSQHKPTGFICAIKKILKSTIQEYGMIDQLTNELKIHYSLNHPNIIKLYSHFEDEYHIFLLMELAPHGSLIDRLHMSEAETSKIVDQVTEALVQTHRMRIIHRDIKPENIVVTMDVPKLCDFGWATTNESKMHQTFCGTLDYVSPQMKDLGEYNQSIDLWSVGVLTFELLAGFPPFKQEISNWKMKGSKRSMKWSWQVLYPPQIQDQPKSFIQNLLKIHPILRSSLTECKNHPFLKGYRDKQVQTQWSEEINGIFQ